MKIDTRFKAERFRVPKLFWQIKIFLCKRFIKGLFDEVSLKVIIQFGAAYRLGKCRLNCAVKVSIECIHYRPSF